MSADLKALLRNPPIDIVDKVEYLINREVCSVDDPELLVTVVNQSCFPGQLRVARALVCAGAPVDAARRIANSRFESLWELIVGTPEW